jgi:hypothetical protein
VVYPACDPTAFEAGAFSSGRGVFWHMCGTFEEIAEAEKLLQEKQMV